MRIGSLNLPHDALVRAYTQHYAGTQVGSGMLPAFEGAMYQDGSGLGDVLRSVFRAVFPIFSSGASTFLRGAAEGLGQGKSLGDAAKGALEPTMQDVLGKTVSRVMQKGSGKRRKRRTKRAPAKPRKRRVYKRKSHAKTHKRHSKRRKLSPIPINF